MIEKGEGLLHLNIYFKLPKDFNGDLNDAIQALLDYRRGEKNHQIDYTYNPEISLYENWLEMVNTTDRVLFGKTSLSKIDENNLWEDTH